MSERTTTYTLIVLIVLMLAVGTVLVSDARDKEPFAGFRCEPGTTHTTKDCP